MRYKKAWAKATVFLNVAILFAGGEFDDDRHGGQGQIKGDTFTLYDWGGMSTETPTAADRKVLASIVFEALKANKESGKKITDFLSEKIQQVTRETGQSPEHLVRVQRALLSQGDFARYLTEDDFRVILESIQNADLIHKDIKFEFKRRAVFSVVGDLFKGKLPLKITSPCRGAVIEISRQGVPIKSFAK